MSYEIIGMVLELFGSLFVAFAALRVHHRVLNEHQIDDLVFRTMKREQFIGLIGVILLIAGFTLQVLATL